MQVPKEVKMALRKWTWFCITVGLLGMNGFARYGFAAEENRTPAISMDFQGLTPEFIAWIDQFDQKLEKVLKIRN